MMATDEEALAVPLEAGVRGLVVHRDITGALTETASLCLAWHTTTFWNGFSGNTWSGMHMCIPYAGRQPDCLYLLGTCF